MGYNFTKDSPIKEYERITDAAFYAFDGVGVNHSNRFSVFFDKAISSKTEISDKLYWAGLANAYQGTDNLGTVPRALLKGVFTSQRAFKEYLMSPYEREFLNSLPDHITIYRGMTEKERDSKAFGISWTLSEKTAEFFAFTYNRNMKFAKAKKCVFSLLIEKSKIVAYWNGRNEQEIIYIH